MRLGIVSDVHCNAMALRIALERMGPVDELLCAGDLLYQYRFDNDVLELLRERNARNVLGNHDVIVLSRDGERVRAASHVRRANLDYLAAQPLTLEVNVLGKRLLMTHGSPIAPYDRYVYPNTPALRELVACEADYVILGHTHLPMAERVGRALVINSGSVGEGRRDGSELRLSCAVLDVASGEVTFDAFPEPPRA